VIALALHESVVDAVYAATKTIVTVGPSARVDNGPTWLKLYSAAMMLAALAFTAVFIAGLIDRLLDRRLVAIVGLRTIPRKDHVVVVGLGQVGLRLCMMLRALGVPVVAVEIDPDADNIRRARQYDIPVVIGRGSSRAVLQRLSLARARALAAVTSDEIENIAAAVAALAIRENLRTVLRAGSGDVLDETRALFRIGAVRDVYRIGGTLLAAAALGLPAEEAFIVEETVWVIGQDGRLEPFDAHLETAPRGAPATDNAAPADA
jgi:voltage-gated potassium channel Kch